MSKKVIISEEMFKRQPKIELEINNRVIDFSNDLPKKLVKVPDKMPKQNFSLKRDTILNIRRIK